MGTSFNRDASPREVVTNSFATENELSRELSRFLMFQQSKKLGKINGLA
jgi:hypothetical protein